MLLLVRSLMIRVRHRVIMVEELLVRLSITLLTRLEEAVVALGTIMRLATLLILIELLHILVSILLVDS